MKGERMAKKEEKKRSLKSSAIECANIERGKIVTLASRYIDKKFKDEFISDHNLEHLTIKMTSRYVGVASFIVDGHHFQCIFNFLNLSDTGDNIKNINRMNFSFKYTLVCDTCGNKNDEVEVVCLADVGHEINRGCSYCNSKAQLSKKV